jgi:hypothetical protein
MEHRTRHGLRIAAVFAQALAQVRDIVAQFGAVKQTDRNPAIAKVSDTLPPPG